MILIDLLDFELLLYKSVNKENCRGQMQFSDCVILSFFMYSSFV